MPFLYLPDAISLTLVLIGLTLLRQSIVEHLRQEFLRIREQVRIYWTSTRLPHDEPALVALEQLLDSLIRLAPKVSPARLFFVFRRLLKASKNLDEMQRDPHSELARRIGAIREAKIREALERFQLEIIFRVGVFVLIGSLTGWIFLSSLLFRVFVRLFAHRSGDRLDWSMELMEKLTYRIGRRTPCLVLLTEKPTAVPRST